MITREQQAGELYSGGRRAVESGGDHLHLVAMHLILMINGTADFVGPLWPVRELSDGKIVRLDRFYDYLIEKPRDGIGLPSLYFLKQVLEATPSDGPRALTIVREELKKEDVDFDALAEREHSAELLKRTPGSDGRPPGKPTPGVSLSTGGSDRRAAQLAQRRPELAQQVRDGTLKLSEALTLAGIRKQYPLTELRRWWKRAAPEDRAAFLAEISK